MTIQIDIVPRAKPYEILLEQYKPQLANKFLPEWYKKQKYVHLSKGYATENTDKHKPKTTKNCPAIRDYVNHGIIIPAWSDLIIVKNGDSYEWNLPVADSWNIKDDPLLKMTNHTNSQTDPMPLNNIQNYGTLKLTSPYYFRTPKGYGLQFSDPFYHHRNNIRLLPGKVETDIWHEVNFPFEFTKDIDKKETERIYLKAGDPLIALVPYKKDTKISLNLSKSSEEFNDIQSKHNMISHSKSSDWYDYKKVINEEE